MPNTPSKLSGHISASFTPAAAKLFGLATPSIRRSCPSRVEMNGVEESLGFSEPDFGPRHLRASKPPAPLVLLPLGPQVRWLGGTGALLTLQARELSFAGLEWPGPAGLSLRKAVPELRKQSLEDWEAALFEASSLGLENALPAVHSPKQPVCAFSALWAFAFSIS